MRALLFFFFQAEDGIRDYKVTGVQTCALPISLLARVQAGAGDAGERIDTLRAAIAWFESGLTVAADDETLHDAVRTARGGLWPTYEEAANALLQRQEFHVARRLLREAQADEDCPSPVQASFREMLAATFGGEVGQLTADAIRR